MPANQKFQQDWRGGTRGLVTIEYVGNEFLENRKSLQDWLGGTHGLGRA